MMKTKMLAATAAIGLLAAPGLVQAQAADPQTAPGQAAPAGAAPAQAGAPALAQGSAIFDPQGGSVGKIDSVDGDFVVLATAKSKVRLPKSSFAAGAKGPVIAMTAAQIDQAAAQAAPAAGAQASATAKVTQGASVVDTAGGAVGTVSAADAQFATVDLTTGGKVRLPVSAFGAGENGSLRVAMTAAQLSAAAGASASADAAKPSSGS